MKDSNEEEQKPVFKLKTDEGKQLFFLPPSDSHFKVVVESIPDPDGVIENNLILAQILAHRLAEGEMCFSLDDLRNAFVVLKELRNTSAIIQGKQKNCLLMGKDIIKYVETPFDTTHFFFASQFEKVFKGVLVNIEKVEKAFSLGKVKHGKNSFALKIPLPQKSIPSEALKVIENNGVKIGASYQKILEHRYPEWFQ